MMRCEGAAHQLVRRCGALRKPSIPRVIRLTPLLDWRHPRFPGEALRLCRALGGLWWRVHAECASLAAPQSFEEQLQVGALS